MSVASVYLALSMMDPVIGADIYVYLKIINVNILLIYILLIFMSMLYNVDCILRSAMHITFLLYINWYL